MGETDLKESLRREVKEETGLDIEVGEPFYSWVVKFPPHPIYKVNDVYLVAYRCKYVSGEVKLSEEHKSYKWVDRNNYRENGYHEIDDFTPHLRALEKYFEGG